jgi:hypothetical protein
MNLYLISQSVNQGYDTYDAAVVAAENEENAKLIHPNGGPWDGKREYYGSWCAAEDVKVDFIGVAIPETDSGVISASFNAG